ncbi:hypothetical protein SAMN04489842_3113 [Natronobacterium texcoconense]|uniref:Uncharacterized protein n=1 Tax=Natronobacterium texcoconense TaxID=1095778 RepID=A0A1H1HWR0_NATTX|nr:hypothetical protein SAMN04489842_3113 [Natronobacterium texcoconense]
MVYTAFEVGHGVRQPSYVATNHPLYLARLYRQIIDSLLHFCKIQGANVERDSARFGKVVVAQYRALTDRSDRKTIRDCHLVFPMTSSRQAGTWLGLGLLSLGAYLPWVTSNPLATRHEIRPRPVGLDPGFEIWGVLLLSLVGLTSLGLLLGVPRTNTGVFRGIVGGTALILPIWFLIEWGITGYFIAGSGVYVTAVGGFMIIAIEFGRMNKFNSPDLLSYSGW